jgi:hypothetical protein
MTLSPSASPLVADESQAIRDFLLAANEERLDLRAMEAFEVSTR